MSEIVAMWMTGSELVRELRKEAPLVLGALERGKRSNTACLPSVNI